MLMRISAPFRGTAGLAARDRHPHKTSTIVEVKADMTQIVRSLSVGEIARRSGVAVSTIHFYEGKGLIEGWRTDGNQRRYDRTVLRRIAIIRVAQKAGVRLSAVKAFFATIPAGRALGAEDWRRLTLSWTAMIEERIVALTQLRDELGSCIGCGCLSLSDCPLRNADDRLGRDGPGPRLLMR
jgi:MerR family redox-sensitive transcriptional activator SoxR